MRNVILSLDAGEGYGTDTTGSHFLKLLNAARMVMRYLLAAVACEVIPGERALWSAWSSVKHWNDLLRSKATRKQRNVRNLMPVT